MEKVTKKTAKKAVAAAAGTEKPVNAWNKYDEATLAKVNAFCEEYRKFISENKTERECADAIVAKAAT